MDPISSPGIRDNQVAGRKVDSPLSLPDNQTPAAEVHVQKEAQSTGLAKQGAGLSILKINLSEWNLVAALV